MCSQALPSPLRLLVFTLAFVGEGGSFERMSSCCGQTPSSASPVGAASCCGGGEGGRSKGQDLTWFRVAIALVLAGQGMVFGLGYNNALRAGHAPEFGTPVYWILHGALFASAMAVILMLGGPLLRESWSTLKAGKISADQLFLVTMSGAFFGSVISTLAGEGAVYYEVVGVVLAIYTVGRKVGQRTRDRALAEAGALREDFNTAFRIDAAGDRQKVPVASLSAGDEWVSVFPGEPVPVDGVIVEGAGEIRETAVTGELMPAFHTVGSRLFAGSYAMGGPFRLRVEAGQGERTLDRILGAVESAARRPSKAQIEADRLMRYFLPIVIFVSISTFLVWLAIPSAPWWRALFNAMAVLLVACPCALGLATPIAVWSGLLGLSRRGLVGRSGALLDAFAKVDLWIFDKTGTLSEEDLAVQSADWLPLPNGPDAAWLRTAVASLEDSVDHPVARALSRWEKARLPVKGLQVVPGTCVSGKVEDIALAVGRIDWLENEYGLSFPSSDEGKARVGVVLNGLVAGRITLSERLRSSSVRALQSLVGQGAEVRILTGDLKPAWREISSVQVESGITPERKRQLVLEAKDAGKTVIFVGDGINDAAAMSEASAGIAMGGASALTRATADAALLGDDLSALPWASEVARDVIHRLKGNLRFAVVYNAIGMSLAAAGMLHPVVAALLMLVSSAWVSWRAARPVAVDEASLSAVSATATSRQWQTVH